MLRTAEKRQAVIYRHPRGRFEIVETSWVNADGSSVRIRETVMTPQRDKRGLCSNLLTDAEVQRSSSAENAAPMPEGRHYRRRQRRAEKAARLDKLGEERRAN